ncbi:TrmH family RNA methyltransferase [Ichthyenterobacterium sp. W332]|uniref:TrmH family RNA methyltransferase n=1 Tax=Microcosmobacter mediterraneus TaxID=3075607 RepID=A0ABU2YN14_9FLAO|nr:TrmH family RNA methyltransferase [Ichthyenterobacterium sp. W332]MDT0559185.1 TrmH family RNA methyltransferase [Ichthyenterobacterium sp. W332]
MIQLDHYSSKFKPQKFPITLVCDNVTNSANIGSLFRIADAFGIEKLILCGEHIPLGRKMKKTSRATEKSVNYEIKKNALDVISELKSKDNFSIALELTENSQTIHKLQLKLSKPITLVVGDENFGISEPVLKLCDLIIHIEMYGQNSSMNVVQATNIALYEITKQLM